MRRKLYVGIAAALAATMYLTGQASADHYVGKMVTVINGFSRGGGSDITTRTFVRHWRRHLTGVAGMTVRNIPGRGGVKATNFVYSEAKSDGLTVLMSPWAPVAWVLGAKGIQFDYARMEFIGGGATARISYIRAGAGVATPERIGSAKNLRLAGSHSTGNFDILNGAALQLMGVDYIYIPGYQASPQRLAALQSGQADIDLATTTFYRAQVKPSMIDRQRAMPLWYFPSVRSDGTVDHIPELDKQGISSLVDIYRLAHDGKYPSGPAWDVVKWLQLVLGNLAIAVFAPPGTPADAIAELRTSFDATRNDPAYIKEAAEQGALSFSTVEEGEKIVKSLPHTDPNVILSLRKIIAAADDRKRQ